MKDRLKALRKTLGIKSQQVFAERLGMKRNTYAKYETGENAPSDTAVTLICRTFGVNEKWLRYGEGEMFHTSTKAEKIAAFVGDALANEPEDVRQRILYAFARLSPEGWELLDDFLDDLQAENAPAEDPAES